MSEQNNTIGLKPISELLGMNFFIPSYQRGYRWTEQQVKDLLDNHCSGHYFGIPNNQSCCYLFYSLQRPRTLADCFEVT